MRISRVVERGFGCLAIFFFNIFSLSSAHRFVAPKYSSWADLDILHENGKCWVIAHVCRLHPEYAGISDDFDEAYQKLHVDTREDACLARASFHWKFCGNAFQQPVTMTFRPTGATSSYPPYPEDILDSADMRTNHTGVLAIVYSAVYGGYDPIKTPVRQTVPTEFWMFTDDAAAAHVDADPDAEPAPWIVVEAPPPHPSPRLAAKWFKVFPEQVGGAGAGRADPPRRDQRCTAAAAAAAPSQPAARTA